MRIADTRLPRRVGGEPGRDAVMRTEGKEMREEGEDHMARIAELEARLAESRGDNRASELLVDVLGDRVKEGERRGEELKQEVAALEEDNRGLREYTENLRSDIESLLKLSCRARDTGVWDPHDLSFCEVTFEQVCPGARRVTHSIPGVWHQ